MNKQRNNKKIVKIFELIAFIVSFTALFVMEYCDDRSER
jgi:hypothetical protein